MDVLLNLKGLIRRVRQNEVCRENLMKLRKLRIYRFTEARDLLFVAHVDCQRNGAAALPTPTLVLPGVVVQILCRGLIAAADLDEISQIHRGTFRCSRNREIADALSRIEFSRRDKRDFEAGRVYISPRR